MSKGKKEGFVSLKKGFEQRKKIFHNRASAIFPLYITKKNDFFLVFFNYWKNKNNIKSTSISMILYIYDQEGNLVERFNNKISEFHNQFSIAEILKDKFKDKFQGTVSVEIISLEKLSFPFPAVIGVYKSRDLFSSVHSAGRIKNLNEKHEIFYTDETNWTCKFDKGVSPFFHYFVGPTLPKEKTITVCLYNENKKLKKMKKIDIQNIKPFGSKMFFAKDIFKKVKYERNDFISVKVEHNSIFPRLVVGNYFKKEDFFETTHSFPFITRKDYCPKVSDKKFQSKLSAYRNEDLELNLKVFPTNCEGSFKGNFFTKNFKENKLEGKKILHYPEKSLSKMNIFPLQNNTQFLSLKMEGKKVPSRFNASFVYKVKNSKSNYSVDIADGARSCITPQKISHWGHGYIGDGYETLVMIINDSYNLKTEKKALGELDIYSSKINSKGKIKVEIKPDSLTVINISKLEELSELKSQNSFFSWFLRMKEPGCEAFWVTYRKSDGVIFGDHSF